MSQLKPILGTMTFSDQVDEPGTDQMINTFAKAGHTELDTAHIYNDGKTEVMLGRLLANGRREKFYIASKANPWNKGGLSPDEIRRQLDESLTRLQTNHVDLFYLHAPDPETPIEKTLRECQELYAQGKFRHLGLSNYAAWQVAEIVELCRKNDWIKPVVYQGMYNALTRDVERELLPCLRNYGIKFYAYNPLAGGLLTCKHDAFGNIPGDGRFADNQVYQQRYWKQEYFQVLGEFSQICRDEGIAPSQAALQWMSHHSELSAGHGDGIILGASRHGHLVDNLVACTNGPLPDTIVTTLQNGWEVVRPYCIKYFRP